MSDDDFRREIRMKASYDHRDNPDDRRGAEGANLLLVLSGPLGAVSCTIATGWVSRPLAGPYVHGAGRQNRRRKPGVDAPLADMYPTGSGVTTHTLAPTCEGEEPRDGCEWLGGQPCYGETSYLASDPVLAALVAEGDEGAWRELRGYYDRWLAGESA